MQAEHSVQIIYGAPPLSIYIYLHQTDGEKMEPPIVQGYYS